jgi:hypothetical protein
MVAGSSTPRITVGDLDRAAGVLRGQAGVVDDDHQRLAGPVEVEQQLADLLAGGGVQRAGEDEPLRRGERGVNGGSDLRGCHNGLGSSIDLADTL